MLERPGRVLIAAAFAMIIIGVVFRLQTTGAPRRSPALVQSPARFSDDTGLFPEPYPAMLDATLDHILSESGVDLRVMIVKSAGGALEDFAVKTMRARGIGHDVGGRGMLIVIEPSTRRARIEVGPPLQGAFPDGFVGYLLREHLAPMFAGGQPELAIRTTLFMIHRRIRFARLGQEYDPRFIQYVDDLRRLASGGGASSGMTAPTGIEGILTRAGGADAAAYFSPQPTVEGTYQRYIESLALGLGIDYLPLYTEDSRPVQARQPRTRGWSDYLLSGEYGFAHAIDQRGELAMLYYTGTPFRSPLFFRHGPAGWQIDVAAEVRNSQEVIGTIYTWRLKRSGDEFSRVFADRYKELAGTGFAQFSRVAGGDNRALCVRGQTPSLATAGQSPADCEPFAPLPDGVAYYTVSEAAGEISSRLELPALVVLYDVSSPATHRDIDAMVHAAGVCRSRGLTLRFYQVDYTRESLEELPGFLAAHHAPFRAAQLYPWPAGLLGRAFAPRGIRVDASWHPPLAAVVTATSRALWQREKITDWTQVERACGNVTP